MSSNVASWKNPQTKWLGKSSMNLWSMHERFPIATCDYGWGSFFLRIMSGWWFVGPQTGSLGTVDQVLLFDDWLGRFETSSGTVPVLLCQRSRRTGWAWAKCFSTGPKNPWRSHTGSLQKSPEMMVRYGREHWNKTSFSWICSIPSW